jgi:hypothetical protein
MARTTFLLLDAVTSNGNKPAIKFAGGTGFLGLKGVLGGATVKVQWCPMNSAVDADWYDLDSTMFLSTLGSLIFSLPSGFIRAVIASATGTTNLTAYVRDV